jgi:tetratricopeptide (TPR) repeat protein
MRFQIPAGVLIAVLFSVTALASHAPNHWLEEVRFAAQSDGAATVQVVFTESIQYLSHFPPDTGETLTVYLRVPALANAQVLPIRQEIASLGAKEAPLSAVVFDADEREAVLRIRFTGATHYRVLPGRDDKTLVVILPQAATPQTLDERAKALLNQGRDALTRGDADRAIQIFSGVLSLPEHSLRADALELLGVARERKGQRAHAKAVYEEYLEKFPKGEGADRVRQRLAELLGGELKPQEKLKELKVAPAPASPWSHSGSFGQYYYRGENDIGGGVDAVDQSMLLTQFSWNSQRRGERFDGRFVANINHTRDFLDAPEDAEINSLYAQLKDKRAGWYAKLGRQSSPGGGVLGRFDGLFAQAELANTLQLDVVTGYLVEFTEKNTVQTQRPFWSVAAELGPYWDYLEAMPYYARQDADGMLDREAAGWELRFFHPRGNVFNLVDYDLSYDELNIVLLRGQYSFLESSSVYGYYDARKSPPIATTNALIAEADADSLKDLQALYTREEIRDLARKRTGESTTATLGASHTLSPRVQLSGDITVSEQKSPVEPIADGEPFTTQDDRQTYYALQVVTSRLVNERDTLLFGLRYTQADSYDSGSITLAHRLPFGARWRFDARLRYDRRDNDDGDELTKTMPNVRVEYRPTRTIETQLELGAEMWDYGGASTEPSYTRRLINVGFRWLF